MTIFLFLPDIRIIKVALRAQSSYEQKMKVVSNVTVTMEQIKEMTFEEIRQY